MGHNIIIDAFVVLVLGGLGSLRGTIVASFLAPQRVEPKLVLARDWLRDNGRMLTSLIMFMIGVVILGSGLAQL